MSSIRVRPPSGRTDREMKAETEINVKEMSPPPESGVMDDRQLVQALMEADETAWNYVVTELITPLVRSNIKGIAEMLRRCSIPVDALAGKVFLDLRKNNFVALRNFRYECRFSSFLYWRLYYAAQGLIRENGKEILLPPSDGGDEGTLTEPKDPTDYPKKTEVRDEIESTNRLLARLWKQNPTYALVLLLRIDLGLSSKVVGAFLGKTISNVDQINIRAQKAMRKFRDEDCQ